MDPIAAARDLLPAWVPWLGPAAAIAAAAVGTLLVGRLGRRIAFDPPPEGAHWTERARRAYPLRVANSFLLLISPVAFGGAALLWVGPFAAIAPWATALIAGSLSLVLALRLHLKAMASYLERPPSFGYWLRGGVTFLLVMRPLLPMLAVLIAFAPAELLSASAALWLVGALILYALTMSGQALHLARLIRVAKPADARLRRIVEAACAHAHRAPPPTWEVVWPTVNAAAFPLGGKLVFSDAALAELDDDELEAVASHEIGHLDEPRGVKLTRATIGFIWIPFALVVSRGAKLGWVAIYGAIGAILLLNLALRRWARRLEERADEQAHHHDEAYGRALATMYRVNAMPAVLSASTTHPHLYDRLEAAGAAPSFARPAPPSRRRGLLSLLAAFLLPLIVGLGLPMLLPFVLVDDPPTEGSDTLMLAFHIGGAWELGDMAERRLQRDATQEALTLYEAAVALTEPGARQYGDRARLVALYVGQGRCEDAQRHADWILAHPEHEDDPASTDMATTMIQFCGGLPSTAL